MSSSEKISKFIHALCILHSTLVVYRWQTDRYHRRQTVEQLMYEVDKFMDSIVLSYQGRTNHRIFFQNEKIHLNNVNDLDLETALSDVLYLVNTFRVDTIDVDQARAAFLGKLYETLYELTLT